jgi:GT2 family glycosyltransferase
MLAAPGRPVAGEPGSADAAVAPHAAAPAPAETGDIWGFGPEILAEPHHLALELAAARLLAAGKHRAALMVADRRCRIAPPPDARSFVLRADALFGLGDRQAALRDLAMALDIAAQDLAANRRMLAWGRGRQRAEAAIVLLAGERDAATLRAAMATLEQAGRRCFAAISVLDDQVLGWAAWPRAGTVNVTIAGSEGTVSAPIAPDPFHPLANDRRHAAAFALPRGPSRDPVTVSCILAEAGRDRVLHTERAPPNVAVPPAPPPVGRSPGSGVTVIVPVYADPEATQTCLERLLAELPRGGAHRAIVVDDASPDVGMASCLARLAGERRVTLLANPRNLGFVASVNRALAAAEGSVILLNADTVPPPGFIDRLAATAARDARIGVVVPLSNNGEFTSYPEPNVATPLAAVAESLRLDAVAARVNRGTIVDIPSGTGFCMLVTAACRARTGGLAPAYHRGYFEDADLCLRARGEGFRIVCDPSVFVGHVGSRSFGGEKRHLAARNFAILEHRFPGYARECAAFTRADPLAPYRAAIAAGDPVAHSRPAPARPASGPRRDGGSRPRSRRPRIAATTVARPALGIVAGGAGRAAFGRLRDIVLALRRLSPALPVIVLGATLDDIRLMRIGNVFVTGSLTAGDLVPALMTGSVRAVAVIADGVANGQDLAAVARSAGLPVAWIGGKEPGEGRPGDIVVAAADAAAGLAAWMRELAA